MGTFGGHALPGSFFIIFAVWWTSQVYRRYFRSLRKNEPPFRSSVTFPFDCLCGRAGTWPWEGILKLFFTSIGFAGEIITAFKDGQFTHLGNGQHATMFFFFGLSGAIDILVHFRFPLPKDIDYVIATLAFIVEDVLFMFHLHGRTPLDMLIHTLLVYVIHANVIICLIEMKYRRSVIVNLSRCYIVFLQGTWFWQAGFILYNPIKGAEKWDPENHEQMMVVTMIFAWHMAGVFFAMMTIGLIVNIAGKNSNISQHITDGDQVQLKARNGYKARDETALLEDESGSESEDTSFQKPYTLVP